MHPLASNFIPFFLVFLIAASSLPAYQLNRPDLGNFMEPPSTKEGSLKIAGMNVKLRSITDHPNNIARFPKYEWKYRIAPLLSLIEKDAPAVLGLSETTFSQIQDLEKSLSGYSYEGFCSASNQSYRIWVAGAFESEFIGFLFNSQRIELQTLQLHELGPGKKSKRILVEGRFLDKLTNKPFAVLVSHFDSSSLEARFVAGKIELQLIEELEHRGIPWFSIGDRNWFYSAGGQECAEEYINYPYIVDFRDDTSEGHFGPPGTFPGHLELAERFAPLIQTLDCGLQQIKAATLDVGFRSKNLCKGINSYSYTGEFDPSSLKLYLNDQQGILSEKNFISDHYYIGGTFELN